MSQVQQPMNLQLNSQVNEQQQYDAAPVIEHREIEIQTTPRNDENDVNNFPSGGNTPDNDRIVRNGMANQQNLQSPNSKSSMDYNANLNPDSVQRSQLAPKQQQLNSPVIQPKKPCERCKAGIPDQQLKQRKKEVAALKVQNDRLINNLREMSIKLDETLEKVKLRNYEKPSVNSESSREVNEKELENAKQQIEFYNKQLAQYASLGEDCSSKRMGQWHSAVKEIEIELADCKILNKNLLYIKREQERTMTQNKDVGRLKILRDDVILHKNLLRDAQKVARENEKGFKKTQEHTNKLKQRHQEVCTQFGIPYAPFESLPKETKLELLIHEKNEQNEVLATHKVNEQSTLKLQQDIKIIEDCLKSIRKQGRTDQKAIITRIKEVEDQRDSLTQSISKKDKEIQEAYDKLNTYKSIFSNSQTIGFSEASKPQKSSSALNIAPYIKKYKETRKEIKGLLGGSGLNSQSFEDSSQLPDTKDQAISQINFWFVDDMIMGLETVYQLSNGEMQSVCSFDAGPKMDLMKQSTLTLYGTEYISQVEGFYNFHCLEFLRIQTSRGNLLEVGSKRNLARCKRFSYEIRKNEIPVAFLGSTDLPFLRKDERIKDYGKPEVRDKFRECPVLVNFGIEVRKKDVYQEPLKNMRPLTGSENQGGKFGADDRRRVSGEERQSPAQKYINNNSNNYA